MAALAIPAGLAPARHRAESDAAWGRAGLIALSMHAAAFLAVATAIPARQPPAAPEERALDVVFGADAPALQAIGDLPAPPSIPGAIGPDAPPPLPADLPPAPRFAEAAPLPPSPTLPPAFDAPPPVSVALAPPVAPAPLLAPDPPVASLAQPPVAPAPVIAPPPSAARLTEPTPPVAVPSPPLPPLVLPPSALALGPADPPPPAPPDPQRTTTEPPLTPPTRIAEAAPSPSAPPPSAPPQAADLPRPPPPTPPEPSVEPRHAPPPRATQPRVAEALRSVPPRPARPLAPQRRPADGATTGSDAARPAGISDSSAAGDADRTALAAAAPKPGPPLITNPRFRRPPRPPEYPPRAVELDLTGVVLVRALLDPDGDPRETRVQRSSGHAMLDAAALAAVRGWAFEPAARDGQRVAAWVEIPVRFQLR